MAELTTGQRLTVSLDAFRPEITDNVINNNALLSKLKEKKAIIKLDGGVNIAEKLAYSANSTVRFHGEYDFIDTTPQKVIDQALFATKILSGSMTISELDTLQNDGGAKILSAIDAQKKVLISSLQNKMGASLFGDGTSDGGESIGGMQLIVADNPTIGTVGGIDRATNTFWRNQSYTLSTQIGRAHV